MSVGTLISKPNFKKFSNFDFTKKLLCLKKVFTFMLSIEYHCKKLLILFMKINLKTNNFSVPIKVVLKSPLIIFLSHTGSTQNFFIENSLKRCFVRKYKIFLSCLVTPSCEHPNAQCKHMLSWIA